MTPRLALGAHATFSNVSRLGCRDRPPVIFFVPRLQHTTARIVNVTLQFALLVQVIVAMESLGLVTLANPGDHAILFVTFVPASAAVLLLQRPGIEQDLSALVRL